MGRYINVKHRYKTAFITHNLNLTLTHTAYPDPYLKARGGRGVKMPYFDFSICYRAGKNEQDAKKQVNLTSPSRDIVPQRLGFTCNCILIGSLNFKPSYLWTALPVYTGGYYIYQGTTHSNMARALPARVYSNCAHRLNIVIFDWVLPSIVYAVWKNLDCDIFFVTKICMHHTLKGLCKT